MGDDVKEKRDMFILMVEIICFSFIKKTKHPAKQLAHTEKTWTNKRYTHHPNDKKNYILDEELSTPEMPVYYHKSAFIDSIYTRGLPYSIKKKKRQ